MGTYPKQGVVVAAHYAIDGIIGEAIVETVVFYGLVVRIVAINTPAFGTNPDIAEGILIEVVGG